MLRRCRTVDTRNITTCDVREAEVTIEVYAGDTTIEIVIEAPKDHFDRKRFAHLNLPRDQFSAALGHAAQRKSASRTKSVT